MPGNNPAPRIAAPLPLGSRGRIPARRPAEIPTPNGSPLLLLASVRLVGVIVTPDCITLPLDEFVMVPQALMQQLHRLHVIREEVRERSRLRRRRRFALHHQARRRQASLM